MLYSRSTTDLSDRSAVGQPIDKLHATIMKTLKGNKVAVIKNGLTAEEMREIEKEFWSLETVKYSIGELVKIESAKKAKA